MHLDNFGVKYEFAINDFIGPLIPILPYWTSNADSFGKRGFIGFFRSAFVFSIKINFLTQNSGRRFRQNLLT
jgi:hypothetical protein